RRRRRPPPRHRTHPHPRLRSPRAHRTVRAARHADRRRVGRPPQGRVRRSRAGCLTNPEPEPLMPQPNMQKMMKQVQKMQADMARAQDELAAAEVTASVGGGMVTVKATGALVVTVFNFPSESIYS